MPWRANFPIIRDPARREDHLVFWMKPIEDARPGYQPSYCDVVGMARDESFWKFTVALTTWERSLMVPKHFVECGEERALDKALWQPSFPVLVDPQSLEKHIIYKRDPMKGDPVFCRVTGMAKNGTLRAFVVSSHDYELAGRKQFIESTGISSPSAILVDPSGRPLV
jgi:hypothetical protein